jgi:uncharacterized protein
MFWIKQKELLGHLKDNFLVDWYGIHGIKHWARVLKNGLMIARIEGAREDVVRLFAFLHDHKRENEGRDELHGLRAYESARDLRGKFFDIDTEGFLQLEEALTYHSDGLTQGNLTVRTCWDADRLDLGRCGTMPWAPYLCTETARNADVIAAAYKRSIR